MENSQDKKPKRPRIGQNMMADSSERPRYDRPYENRPRPTMSQHYDGDDTLSDDSASFGAPRTYQRPNQPRQQGSYQRPYQPRNDREGGYQPRPQRPYNSGHQRPQYGEQDNSGYRRPYNPNYQRPQREYTPRQDQGSYQRPARESGYQPRPRQGEYQQRRTGGYGQQRPEGYTPRQEGGLRRSYGAPQQGGSYGQRRSYGQQGPNRQGQRPGAFSKPGKSFVPRPKRVEYEMPIPDPNETMRLNKFMSNSGICSRREADEFIQQGLVKVNGEVVTTLGTKISHSDVVEYDNKVLTMQSKCYILLNKPKDCVTTTDDPGERMTVMDLVKGACSERIYPVGRLDRNTTGVLLLTNDGDLASKLTHPSFVKKKIYHVWTDRDISEEDMQKIADGIELEDGPIHADAISYATETDRNQAGIEIHSGRNRIVRRIFESLGYHVTKLDRVYFAGLTKKNLPRGRWRYLTQEEVNILKRGSFE